VITHKPTPIRANGLHFVWGALFVWGLKPPPSPFLATSLIIRTRSVCNYKNTRSVTKSDKVKGGGVGFKHKFSPKFSVSSKYKNFNNIWWLILWKHFKHLFCINCLLKKCAVRIYVHNVHIICACSLGACAGAFLNVWGINVSNLNNSKQIIWIFETSLYLTKV